MLFKVNDVLEYNNGYYAIITLIEADNIFLDLSDGSHFIIKKHELINGVINGNIKIKHFTETLNPYLGLGKNLDYK